MTNDESGVYRLTQLFHHPSVSSPGMHSSACGYAAAALLLAQYTKPLCRLPLFRSKTPFPHYPLTDATAPLCHLKHPSVGWSTFHPNGQHFSDDGLAAVSTQIPYRWCSSNPKSQITVDSVWSSCRPHALCCLVLYRCSFVAKLSTSDASHRCMLPNIDVFHPRFFSIKRFPVKNHYLRKC